MSLVVVNATGPTTTTLPLISSVPGLTITIKDSGSASATNTITIQPTAGNTFEKGVSSYILNTPLAYITFLGNPTTLKWRVIATTYADVPITIAPVARATGTLGGVTGALTTLSVAGLTTLGNSSNTGNLGVAGTTTLSNLAVTGNATFSSLNAYNINFTSSITSNGLPFSGGGGAVATSGFAQINLPMQSSRGICFDPSGNMYVNTSYSGTIYKITPQGVTSLLAGNYGVAGTTDGTGSGALFVDSMQQMCYDSYTNCIVATNVTNLRLISLTGVVTTIASGFTYITGVCSDGLGNYYVTEVGLCLVKKVTISSITPAANSGTVTTIAGTSGVGGYVNGTGLAAQFWNPYHIVINSTKTVLYIADANNHVIRQMTIPGAIVTTLAGPADPTRTSGYVDSTTSTSVCFNYPLSMTIDASNNLYVGDYGNNMLRYINQSPFYTLTLAGAGSSVTTNSSGVGTNGKVYQPHAIALDINGNPWISTYGGNIFNYTLKTGYLSIYYQPTTSVPKPGNIQNTAVSTIVTPGVATGTILGSGFTITNSNSANPGGATYIGPMGVAIDSQNNVYVADSYKIKKIFPSGLVTSIYGDPSNTQTSNFPGTGALSEIANVYQMCFDTSGNMYCSDYTNHCIVRINLTTHLAVKLPITSNTTLANQGLCPYGPLGILYNNSTLYVSNRGSTGPYIISINLSTNAVTLMAGTPGSAGGYVDNVVGTSAKFGTSLFNICFDSIKANIYACDYTNNKIRIVTIAGQCTVSTLIPTSGSINLLLPVSIAIDAQNNLYVAQGGPPVGIIKIPYIGPQSFAYGPSSTFSTTAGGVNYASPNGIAIDSYNNVYFADYVNKVVYYINPAGTGSIYSGITKTVGTQDSTYASSLTLLAPYIGIGKTNPQYPLDIGVVTNFNSNVNFSTNAQITTTSGFAQMNLPLQSSRGICFDPAGNMYVNSSYSGTIYKITPQGVTSLLAGSYGLSGTTDGIGSGALFVDSLQQMCYDSYTGCIAVANKTALRLISLTGVVTTIASGFTTHYGVCSDGSGKFYITDDHRVKKVTITSRTPAANSGTVETFVGDTASYVNGNGGNFNNPYHIVINSAKSYVYVADYGNNVIRRVFLNSPYRPVTTLAGPAPTDGSPAAPGTANSTTSTSVRFFAPVSLAIDANDNLYVGDYGNNRIRYINASPFYTLTLAGSGGSGTVSGVGENSQVNTPHAMTIDPYGSLWVVTYNNGAIFNYNLNTGYLNLYYQPTTSVPNPGNIQNTALSTIVMPTIATGTIYGSGYTITNSNSANPGGATYQSPNGVLLDSQNNLYVCDNRRIRKISPSGLVTSVYGDVTNTQDTTQIGTGTEGVSNILYQSICFDNSGNMYVSQYAGNSILRINLATGTATAMSITAGPGSLALNGPNGLLFKDNTLYVMNQNPGNSQNSFLLSINLSTNISSKMAGNDGTFNYAFSICFDVAKTNIYVSNYGPTNIKIVNISNNAVTTFTTSGLPGLTPFYITSDNLGNFYCSGTYTGVPVTRGIIKITSAGVASSFCNTVTLNGATVNIGVPTGLAVDPYNNVYFADANRLFIGIVTPGGSGSVYSGANGTTGTQDSTYASSISLMAPYVGINTANPTSALHVSGNTTLGSYAILSNGTKGLALAANVGLANYSYDAVAGDSVIRAEGAGAGLCLVGSGGYGIRVGSVGTVGISGLLSINSYGDIYVSASGQVYNNGMTNPSLFTFTGGQANISLITQQGIWVKGTYIMINSDERLKKNISTVTDSLDIVNKINIVSYDTIEFDRPSVKHGIIAQEIQKFYPDVVGIQKNFVPSVYKLATYELSGNVIITSPVSTGFAVNDKIRLFINTDSKQDTADYEYETYVLEIISETQFTVAPWDKFELGKDMLIYGKEVDDFLTIDKQQIGILAAGACKILSGQVSTLQADSSNASTITGVQFSTLQSESSQASTITGVQFSTLQSESLTYSSTISTLQSDSSNTSTITGIQFSTLQSESLTYSSTISTLQSESEVKSSTITGLQSSLDSQQSTIAAILQKYPL